MCLFELGLVGGKNQKLMGPLRRRLASAQRRLLPGTLDYTCAQGVTKRRPRRSEASPHPSGKFATPGDTGFRALVVRSAELRQAQLAHSGVRASTILSQRTAAGRHERIAAAYLARGTGVTSRSRLQCPDGHFWLVYISILSGQKQEARFFSRRTSAKYKVSRGQET
jgi:hypothetical protein